MNYRTIRPSARNRIRGVTLLELLAVIAVVAILGSIAVSSYRSYLLRANRTEGRMALLRLQAAQEKFFLQNNAYATPAQLSAAPPGGLGIPATTPSGFYSITLVTPPAATTYIATATAAGGQANDIAACRTLSINETGDRQPIGNDCWR